MKKLAFLWTICLLSGSVLRSEEGMWIPLLLDKYKIGDMQRAGLKLTAEEVYSVNQACLKDALVLFGGGCTGELISGEGLLLTNHHCGYSNIQRHSTVEHDYLTDGFWAMTRGEELPNPGLSVTFLIRMEDVTEPSLKGVSPAMSLTEREKVIQENIKGIQAGATKGSGYTAKVVSFFAGNQFFLFVYEAYTDVRLVGAPPSAIGKFGGDTDNWMWPRHTGDFSLFRIYAGPDNRPAPYSSSNVPYKSRKFLPISLRGVEKGDFTMVFGYPGRTTEYVPSFVIEHQVNYSIPVSIDLRTKRLNLINAAMETSPRIRIQYSAKALVIANTWKKNQGIILGLKKIKAIDRKKEFENRFQEWVGEDAKRLEQYGTLLGQYRDIADKQAPFELAGTYAREAGEAPEIIGFAGKFSSLAYLMLEGKQEEAGKQAAKMKKEAEAYFKDYDAPTDQRILAAMMEAWARGISPEFQPDQLKQALIDFKGDFNDYAESVFDKSKLVDVQNVNTLLTKFNSRSARALLNDPAVLMFNSLQKLKQEIINPGLAQGKDLLPDLQRKYMKAQMEMQPEKLFYPDANSTLRLTFGKIDDFTPADGIQYKHITTLEGIMEKDNPEIYDYRVPEKLKQLYLTKDYGQYASDNTVPVCFTASNHTSGGNSGSPVLNADGQLIGINFDRNWEGTMSDIMYDPELCRNISLDIRFALFIIDKFAGATHLIREMQLIR